MLKKHDGLIGNILRVLSANFWVAFIGLLSSFVFPKILTIDIITLLKKLLKYQETEKNPYLF